MKEKLKNAPEKSMTAAKAAEFFKEKRTSIIYGLLYGAAAYMFGGAELIFETAPLGLAFVCAVREGIPFAAAGMLISALVSGGGNAVMSVSGIIVALGFRYALSFVLHRKDASVFSLNDGLAPRIASAAAGAVTVSLIRVIYGGFRYYDLLAAAFMTICSCGAVYAYSLFTDAENKHTEKYEAGLAAMMFSSVLSLSGISLFGVSVSTFAAFALTLGAARRGGALRGIASGFLCGAAVDISLCPMFGAVGFLCGLLSPLSAYIGVLFSTVAGLFIGLQRAHEVVAQHTERFQKAAPHVGVRPQNGTVYLLLVPLEGHGGQGAQRLHAQLLADLVLGADGFPGNAVQQDPR